MAPLTVPPPPSCSIAQDYYVYVLRQRGANFFNDFNATYTYEQRGVRKGGLTLPCPLVDAGRNGAPNPEFLAGLGPKP